MKELSCKEVQEKLNLFTAGKLSVKETRQVINHLIGCQDCYDEMEVRLLVEKTFNVFSKEHDLDTYDFSHIVDEKIEEQIKRINKITFINVISSVVALGVLMLFILIFILSQGA